MQIEQNRCPNEILGEVAQQWHRSVEEIAIDLVKSSAHKTKNASVRATHLSSTSWNTQLGVCVVVKIRLSGGILGAEWRTEKT